MLGSWLVGLGVAGGGGGEGGGGGHGWVRELGCFVEGDEVLILDFCLK